MSRSPEDISIRLACLQDLDKIIQIERRSFKYPYHPIIFLEFLRDNKRMIFVAEIRSEVVGYVMIDMRPRKKALITSIAVKPEFRRKGVGSSLLLWALDLLKKRVESVELQVAVNNEAAVKFYVKYGFKIARIEKNYYPDGQNAFLMQKKLI